MDQFLQNAQQIFEVARTGRSGEIADFALLIRPDGGLHMIMETPFALDAAAAFNGARTAYRVTRSENGVRVTGRNGDQTCTLQENGTGAFQRSLLQDRALYSITSPLLISSAS